MFINLQSQRKIIIKRKRCFANTIFNRQTESRAEFFPLWKNNKRKAKRFLKMQRQCSNLISIFFNHLNKVFATFKIFNFIQHRRADSQSQPRRNINNFKLWRDYFVGNCRLMICHYVIMSLSHIHLLFYKKTP